MDTARYVEKITTLFGKILVSIELDDEAGGAELTQSQLQGLSYLFHHGMSSIGEIAQGLGTTHPAAVRLVKRLQDKNLVKKAESKADRRISLIDLTDQGRQIVDHVLSKRTEILAHSLSRMSSDELADVMRGLESLLAAALADKKIVESACLRCGDDHIGCCIVNRTYFELTGKTIEKT